MIADQAARTVDPAKTGAPKRWFRDFSDAFGPRILDVDLPVADAAGCLSAVRSVLVTDALLVATVQGRDFFIISRTMVDVSGRGVPSLNPFNEIRA